MVVDSTEQLSGLVIASYGKRYEVELPTGEVLGCVSRGKKNDVACGDQVIAKRTAKHEAVIESILERKTLLFRSNAFRSKTLAANVDQIVIVLASAPSFYEDLLNRCLIAAEGAGIDVLILLNKSDLPETADAREKLTLYRSLGYSVLEISALNGAETLRPFLEDKTSILVGQSGMGKSTIINALLPDIGVRTQIVSTVLDSGKHTTTATKLYHLNSTSHLIDSPGLQEFGLHHLRIEEIEQAFLEFQPYLGHCRFNNCQHSKEPDCSILGAVQDKKISLIRLHLYQKLLAESC